MKKNRKVLRRNKSERIVRVTSESGRPQAGGGRHGRGRTSGGPSSNLSEREEAAQALRRSEERYRTLFDLVPAAVYACDANGIIHEFNHRAAELWGRIPNTNGNVDNRSGFVERFCGSYKIYYPDGRFMPHEKCPMARIL